MPGYFEQDHNLSEFVILGRSNVGKSSLINALLSKNVALASKTPGKTQDLGFWSIPALNVMLVDSPGYGYAKAPDKAKEEWRRMMMTYLNGSPRLRMGILLVDAEVGLMESDKLLAQMLTDIQKTFIVAFTKADKIRDDKKLLQQMETLF